MQQGINCFAVHLLDVKLNNEKQVSLNSIPSTKQPPPCHDPTGPPARAVPWARWARGLRSRPYR